VTLLVRGGRIVDPSQSLDGLGDILIAGGRIAAVAPHLDVAAERIIDVRGLVVVPGLIDMHVHLREPGYEVKETIATGVRAAVRGGFTTVCAMPNTRPVNDRPEVTATILDLARRAGLANVLPIAAITIGSAGAELVDMKALVAAGAVAFSDDGRSVPDSRLMRRALAAAAAAGSLVIDHCEDRALAEGGVMHEGRVSSRLGLAGIPSAAEDIMVARDIILAEAVGAPVHIAHLSTAGGVRLVAEAKARGIRVSAEVTPHHLLLSDEALETPDADLKMNPPLRSVADVAALIKGLRTGTMDAIATDHAPHTPKEKGRGFSEAPFGIVGLETAVSLVLDRLVRPGTITLSHFVDLMSVNPARLLGLSGRGRVVVGADADLTVLDLDRSITVEKDRFESKGRNTPFEGWKLRGAPVMTIVGGRVVYPFEGSPAAVRS
jgi:dihydroorotase